MSWPRRRGGKSTRSIYPPEDKYQKMNIKQNSITEIGAHSGRSAARADVNPVRLSDLAVGFVVALLRFWHQAISPFLGQRCRFEPSCSCYSAEAVQRFGLMGGARLAAKRVLRCHPFHPGGFDPVPQTDPRTSLSEKVS